MVVLHGDGPPPHENPGYQYIFASKVATQNTNVVAVGLLRPGYTDPQGNHSDGDSGRRDGDNWNARNTDAIADAILKLKLKYEASKVIVAGHSGGAAITANILGRHPQLIDAALLVSCPCGDVNKWRESMLRLTNIPVFKGKIDSLSPITQTKNISAQTRIVLMVGTDDPVAPLNFSNEYREVASKAGKNVTLIKLPGRTHDTFIYSKVFKELSTLISLIDEPGN
ncbi:MAG: alpha/beta fold hydrolase [Acidobacteriaceae bacterium]